MNDNPQHSNGTFLKIVWKTVQWLVVAGALFYLYRSGMFSREHFTFSSSALFWLVFTLLVLYMNLVGTALRFHWILKALHQPSKLVSLLRIFFLGMLPLQLGSFLAFDGMRLVMLRKSGMGYKTIGSSLILDRLIGFVGIFLLAVCFAICLVDSERIVIIIGFALLLSTLLFPMCVMGLAKLATKERFVMLSNLPGMAFVTSISDSLRLLANRIFLLPLLVFIATFTHISAIIGIYGAAKMLSGIDINIFESLAGGTMVFAFGAIPLPLSGVGVGENIFAWVVADLRQEQILLIDYAAVFFLYRIISIGAGILSWIFLLIMGSSLFELKK